MNWLGRNVGHLTRALVCMGGVLLSVYVYAMVIQPVISGGLDALLSTWREWQSLNAGMLAFLGGVLVVLSVSVRNSAETHGRFLEGLSQLPSCLRAHRRITRKKMNWLRTVLTTNDRRNMEAPVYFLPDDAGTCNSRVLRVCIQNSSGLFKNSLQGLATQLLHVERDDEFIREQNAQNAEFHKRMSEKYIVFLMRAYVRLVWIRAVEREIDSDINETHTTLGASHLTKQHFLSSSERVLFLNTANKNKLAGKLDIQIKLFWESV